MLVVKTGMDPEYNAITDAIDAHVPPHEIKVLRGVWSVDHLNAALDADCTAIISVGTCGGLCPGPLPPRPVVGQTFVANTLITPKGVFPCNADWVKRITDLGIPSARWWSSGVFNTADDVASRTSIFRQSGATLIDDESYDVARFAAMRNIPFTVLRTVSDTCDITDDVPPAARNAINSGGGFDLFAVLKSLLEQKGQLKSLEHMWTNFNLAIAKLRLALDQVGPYMQAK